MSLQHKLQVPQVLSVIVRTPDPLYGILWPQIWHCVGLGGEAAPSLGSCAALKSLTAGGWQKVCPKVAEVTLPYKEEAPERRWRSSSRRRHRAWPDGGQHSIARRTALVSLTLVVHRVMVLARA